MPDASQSPNIQSLRNRDWYRARLLATAQPRHELITVNAKDGPIEFEVRACSLDIKHKIIDATTKVIPDDKAASGFRVETDTLERNVRAAIACVFVPGTDSRIFEDADLAALRGAPDGSWYQDVLSAAAKMLNGKSPAEASKNSEPTPAESSSSK